MCYALFIGTDHEIAVPSIEEAVELDAFHLEAPQREHDAVRPYFSKPFVYYAASWQGCGCGWFKDVALLQTPEQRRESNERTVLDLRALAALLESLGSSEVFLSWEGELGEGVLRRRQLEPSDFEVDNIPLEQGDFALIQSPGPT